MQTTEAKHTPERWHVRELMEETDWPDIAIDAENGACVAYAMLEDGAEEDNPVLVANARLIAAAPELLEAARWVCRLYGTDHPQGLIELKDYVQELRAVIAKAEARS